MSIAKLREVLEYISDSCPLVGHGDEQLESAFVAIQSAIDELMRLRAQVGEVDFFDAIRTDAEMEPSVKAYWLAQEGKTEDRL